MILIANLQRISNFCIRDLLININQSKLQLWQGRGEKREEGGPGTKECALLSFFDVLNVISNVVWSHISSKDVFFGVDRPCQFRSDPENISLMQTKTVLLLVCLTQARVDYWDEDFDEDKNCVREEEMKELQRDVDQGKCASSSAGNQHM